MIEYRGLVIHIAEGYLDGTLSWQKNPASDVSSHFIVGGPRDDSGEDGLCYQVVDTDIVAWTQRNGNGHWLSVECSGFVPDKLSAAQIEKIAHLFAKCHDKYNVPLVLANDPDDKGLGHHSMGCDYGWGHCSCPGTNIINQKQKILDRAIEIVEGDMPLSDADIDKIAEATLDKFLKERLPIPEDWMVQFPDDPGIQDGEIGLITLWRSGYFHARKANEAQPPQDLKLDEILALLKDENPV